jgi:hypothetical protein
MYIDEFEKIEIVLSKIDKRWISKIGEYEINKPIRVDWKLIKTTTFRTKFMNVKCDDCGLIHERRLRDLEVNNNLHYCKKCYYSGERNHSYGKPQSEGSRIGLEKWRSENTNPFTWESSKKKIKEKKPWLKTAEKNRGRKMDEVSRNNMRTSALISFKEGRRKVNSGWKNIKTKYYFDIPYQGTYELRFIKFIESIGFISLLERGPNISYFDTDNKEHTYFPDFIIKNIVFEIKSSYLWDKFLDKNLQKKEAAEKIYKYYVIIDNNFDGVESIIKNENI